MEALPSHCRRSVIAHELAHLRRRDHWVSWLQMLAECVWWWNPVYWYVRRQLRLNAELACDAWVIETLPGDRRAYAEALIEVTQHVSQAAAPLPALGMNGSARQVFERRLTMIMRDRVPHRLPRAGLFAAGLLAMLAIPGWSQNGSPAQKNENAPKKEKKDLQSYPAEQFKLSEVTFNPDVKLDAVKLVPSGDLTIMLDDLTELDSAKSVSDADKRLQALEQQLQALLKEVQALRQTTKSSAAAAARHVIKGKEELRRWKNVEVRPIQTQYYQLKLNAAPARPVIKGTWVQAQPADAQKVVTLARTTYKLPNDKAEILAAFLREHVKPSVETKVEGDNLTITTTPEMQKAVDNLIGLIQGKPAAAKEKKDGAARALSDVIDPELQLQDHSKVREARFKLLMDAMHKDEADKGSGQKRDKPKP